MPRLVGEVVRLEDDNITILFKSSNQQTVMKVDPMLEEYLVPRMRVVVTSETGKLEVPIVNWQEKNKVKLLCFT